ncbi:N-acetylglucosamine-1-phosphotransferase subunits alpha/beta [Sarcoptes scabiei]|uniref:N-acetylglucosamine-1-phosphotransferase subunits alpha/beta n=1 Tax=Sarcoptes scabiei TaxID=52283 RepID=A0A834VDU1_SARSC|nr:N-acetylglucosamine-1-phosphotransferase subunits alpha/beta [Sarcoptes scabiei]
MILLIANKVQRFRKECLRMFGDRIHLISVLYYKNERRTNRSDYEEINFDPNEIVIESNSIRLNSLIKIENIRTDRSRRNNFFDLFKNILTDANNSVDDQLDRNRISSNQTIPLRLKLFLRKNFYQIDGERFQIESEQNVSTVWKSNFYVSKNSNDLSALLSKIVTNKTKNLDAIDEIDISREKLSPKIKIQSPIRLQIALEEKFFQFNLDSHESIGLNRFFDNNELKYSLRSLYRYASWVRRIYIVTNGQIPNWLNLDHSQIRIVTHKEIFPNQTHLPTFSSSAIECHIHRIPSLSKQFLYFNDDIILGKSIYPDDFITESRGFRIYLSWPVPNCAIGCPLNWLNDGFCDKACNSSRCLWDGGDCLGHNQTANHLSSQNEIDGLSRLKIDRSFEDENRQQSKIFSCSSNCFTNWLGDSVCDQICNTTQCAFDMSDCGGLKQFHKLYNQIEINPNLSQYYFVPKPNSSNIVYMNFTKFYNIKSSKNRSKIGWKLISLSYQNHSSIQAAVFNPKHQILILMFEDIQRLQTNLMFNITAKIRKNRHHFFSFHNESILNFPINITISSQDQSNISIHRNQSFLNDFPINFNPITLTGHDQSDTHHHRHFDNSRRLMKPEIISTVENCRIDSYQERFPQEWRKKFIDLENQKRSQQALQQNRSNKFYETLEQLYKKLICERVFSQNTSLVGNDIIRNEFHKLLREYFDSSIKNSDDDTRPRRNSTEESVSRSFRSSSSLSIKRLSRKLLDAYADSLIYVNHLYNREFGLEARKVPAHMAHFIDRDIMIRMQQYFSTFFLRTSEHRIRHSQDMQLAFAYYYFLMSETKTITFDEIIKGFDVDHSRTLNRNELKTLELNIFGSTSLTDEFQNLLKECCSRCNESNGNGTQEELSISILEQSCTRLRKKIYEKFGKIKSNKFEISDDKEVAFKMLRSNRTLLERELNHLLSERKKFICLNDNFDHNETIEERQELAKMLRNFYESLFPHPSPYELLESERNRFDYFDDYLEWNRTIQQTNLKKTLYQNFIFIFVLFNIILILISFNFFY